MGALCLSGVALFLSLRYGREMVLLMLPRDREANLSVFNLTLEPQQIVDSSESVAKTLRAAGQPERVASRAALIVEAPRARPLSFSRQALAFRV